MNRSTSLKVAVVLGVGALALAACGGGGGGASSSSAAPSSSSQAPLGAVLKIGTLLPQTGSLAFLGPPEFAGVDAAVSAINAAGGVLGSPVEVFDGDSGDTSTSIASQTVDSLLQKGVSAIVGAASSGVTLTVIDKITAAGVVQFSPANTSVALSDPTVTKGLYFRTAPPDTFQGAVLATMATSEGKKNVAVLALQDAYGEGLANNFEKAFTAAGGTLAEKIIYDPKAASFAAEVTKVKASNPDAIVLIGFDESKTILQEMIKQGVGPDKVRLFLCDGNMAQSLADGLPAGIMEGTLGTTPGSAASETFKAELLKADPNLKDFSYAPESYDAVNIIALAAIAANSVDGKAIAAKIPVVSAMGNTECNNFADCAKLLGEGKAISYVGPSGAAGIKANGDPTIATMGIYAWGADNKYTAKDFITGEVPAA